MNPVYEKIKMANLVVMGEAPGNYPRYDPAKHALFPHPPRCAGARLKDLMGMSLFEYVRLDRRNLLDYYPGTVGKGAKFPLGSAHMAVRAMHAKGALLGTNVLLVGKRLSRAFGYNNFQLMKWHQRKAYNFAIVPHTSGVNTWWNDPQHREQGKVFLHSVADQARAGVMTFFVNPGSN